MYTPDNWIIVRIQTPDHGVVDKIIASWNGGFAQSDYWRVNSGIEKIEKINDNEYYAYGFSGSVYCLRTEREGFSSLISRIYCAMEDELSTIENSHIDPISLNTKKELDDQR